MKLWKVCTSLVLALLVGFSATAVVVDDSSNNGAELDLYVIYNTLYSTAYGSSAALQAAEEVLFWDVFAGAQNVSAEARYAGSSQTLGWYQPTGSASTGTDLFTVAPGLGLLGGAPAAFFSPVGQFGFYDIVGGGVNTFYSEPALNVAGEDHMIILATPTPGVYLMAWEDKPFIAIDPQNNGDMDFNDLVVELDRSVVPEPTSMLLLGMGVAGLVVRRVRR